MGLLASIDTGGTHTDIVVVDTERSKLYTHKVPTTPGQLSDGVLDGLNDTLSDAAFSLADVSRLIYGTTLVTNIIIERDAVPVALITTHNFRDVLAMGRANRLDNIYDLRWRPTEPLVPRYLRFGVRERIASSGEIVEALDEQDVRERLAEIVKHGVDTVAICLINSYVNPVHESRIAEIARTEFPTLRVSVSSELMREFREYERTSTTVVNAFVMKPIDEHLGTLEKALHKAGLRSSAMIMRANGGVMSFGAAKKLPVALTHSGPMGGIIGSSIIANAFGNPDLITFDMGGTSSDVSLISNGKPTLTSRNTIAGLPVKLPTLDLVTVGAGGGSIAWIDSAGALKVGPKSAGAVPGPACYAKGGTNPTVTDANLLLGRLNPDWFLAGKGSLDVDLARKAVASIAGRLNLDVMEAALGILAISESHMVNAIKLTSIKRGVDPRGMTLVGFGGAGPLHAMALARELEIKKVIIPCAPGNMSALGMLSANLMHDFVQSSVRLLSDTSAEELEASIAHLLDAGAEWLDGEAHADMQSALFASVDLRYKGQSHELNLPVGSINDTIISELSDAFSKEHHRVYGYSMPEDPVELINLRVSAVGYLSKPNWSRTPDAAFSGVQSERDVWFDASGPVKVPVYRAEGLSEDREIEGPVVIEFTGSTFVAPSDWSIRCDTYGHLHATYKE